MAFNKILILIFSLSYLLVNTHAARTPEARLWNICKPTTNPILCYKTIFPQVINSSFNIYKALEIEIFATQKQVENTSSLMTTLLAKPGNSKDMIESLQTCKDQYNNILDSIQDALKQVANRNAIEARFKFSAVLSFHSTCNDQFTNGNSPIANEAQVVYDLGGNCLDIMKAIEDKENRRKRGVTPILPPITPPTGPCVGVIGLCG
ncbi:hypothetical protein VNO77_25474 [Canavalia gladiata]|uniref:Pectinesterase inhibitor domain-containing protein n=1 Tax=Canavalia gladiata TaxID=3824 RepID=A0AAN9LBK2_CANGL